MTHPMRDMTQRMCDMTQHMCDMTQRPRRMCVTWLRGYVWHDASYVWHDSTHVWHDAEAKEDVCDMTPSLLLYVTWLNLYVTWLNVGVTWLNICVTWLRGQGGCVWLDSSCVRHDSDKPSDKKANFGEFVLLHLECHSIPFSNLNLIGLFSTERGKRDVENQKIDWFLRLEKWHSKFNTLYYLEASREELTDFWEILKSQLATRCTKYISLLLTFEIFDKLEANRQELRSVQGRYVHISVYVCVCVCMCVCVCAWVCVCVHALHPEIFTL